MELRNEETFSSKENLRQRAYYEKYYEDLAAYASRMDELEKHDEAKEAREEMKHVSGILGDLTKESFENTNYEQTDNIQSTSNLNNEDLISQSELDKDQNRGIQEPDQETNQIENDIENIENQAQDQIADIQEENLIPVDKSHFTSEALEAEARADADLAEHEAAMQTRINKIYAENQIDETAENAQIPSSGEEPEQGYNDENNPKPDTNDGSSSEEEDYSYGYGM